MCGSCMWLAMKLDWGIPMDYGTVAGCDFNEHRKQLGVGGVLPVYNVAGGGDLSKTIKEDDCGTAVRSVKPRGRTGEAELARRGEAAKLWRLRSFHSDRVFLHDNLYTTRPIRTHSHECTASICTIAPAAWHYYNVYNYNYCYYYLLIYLYCRAILSRLT